MVSSSVRICCGCRGARLSARPSPGMASNSSHSPRPMPLCPKTSTKGGRPVYLLASMLRIYLLLQWYDLSDPGMEDALIEMPTMGPFAGIDLIRDRIPDETTILAFRHLLEKHDLAGARGSQSHLWTLTAGSTKPSLCSASPNASEPSTAVTAPAGVSPTQPASASVSGR